MEPHNVQWAAQFLVAAELCKRGCSVSFTMGNTTPLADLLVRSTTGEMFAVDVKGQSGNNFWRIREKPPTSNLYYVLCRVHMDVAMTRFFVLTQTELVTLMHAYEYSGVKFNPKHSGFYWTAPLPHENAWDKLPS